MADYDICIVGAGIAGGAMACALQKLEYSVALVEANPIATQLPAVEASVAGFDSRVSAITPASAALIADLGCWEAVLAERTCAYGAMEVWDGEGTGRIHFDASEVRAPQLGHIVENRILSHALTRQVNDCGRVQIYNPAKLESLIRDAGRSALRLDNGDEIQCDLLIGADGALSQIRRLAEFKTREWDYGHHALVCTVETELPHVDTAYQRFMATGPLAFLPLPELDGRYFCSIVWSIESSQIESISKLGDEDFLRRLEGAFESRLGRLMACSPRVAFPLRQRHAVDYVQEGLALVGDAAHTIHPLAGQGINLGLQDVAVLSAELAKGLSNGEGPGELLLLKRYQRQRKGDNLLMMAAMDAFKNLFGQGPLPVRALRGIGMRLADRAGPIKQEIMRRAMGIQ